MNALLFAFLEQAVLAAIAAAGFGVVFNVSARVLIFCAAGHSSRERRRTIFRDLKLTG